MPNRTPQAKALIDSLPIKQPDALCNARGNAGYCKMPAGFRTDHLGKGRCYLHGGRAGRSITHGLYSKKLNSNIKTEYDKLVTDPQLVDLYAEFSFAKTMMSNFLEKIQERLDDPNVNIWTTRNRFDEEVQSPEAKNLMSMLETISRLFVRIVDAETKSKNTLNMKQVYAIVTQIKNAMNHCCGECPVRFSLSEKLKGIRTPIMGDGGD